MSIDLRTAEEELRALVLQAPTGKCLPIIQRPIDNTELQAYMACPREYNLGMLEHRRSEGKSPALIFGSCWHNALETHYHTGGDPMAVAAVIMDTWEGGPDYSDYRNRERVWVEYQKYIRYYGDHEKDTAQWGKTVGYPDASLLEMPVNAVGGSLIHPYAGKIDRIIERDGLFYVEDHKTTSRFDKHYFKQYELSQQMMGYVYMAQLLMPGLRISGVRINLLHVLTSTSNFHREIFPYSPAQLEEWAQNTNRWILRIARDTENKDFPAHYGDNGCSRKFGMCQYYPVCSSSPRIRQKVLEQYYPSQVPWNPIKVNTDGD